MAGTNRKARLDRKVQQQVTGIVDGFSKAKITIKEEPAADGGVGFMYRDEQILVRDEYLGHVQRILGQASGLVKATRVTAGVVLLTLDAATVDSDDRKVPLHEKPAVLAAVDAVDQALGAGIATPNHVLTVCGVVAPCPATEPQMVEDGIEPYPGICTGNSGAGVLIYIADTGLLRGADSAHSWLSGVQRAQGADGSVQDWDWDPGTGPDDDVNRVIPPYAGHGTFVAGVVRCMAPQADVIVSNVFRNAGSALESDFVMELERALRSGVDIFHLSVSAPSRNDLPLLAFERWLALMGQYKGTVCVVAAGNSGVRSPSWPAAFRQTVSVGALTADGRDRADFSNYGGWVDVYAPGRDLINAYATGTYVYHDDPYKGGPDGKFWGMARWSGTSFSTPIVTGLIAARMSRTGENGQEAAAALLRQAQRQAIPGVGAILLPCDK